MTRDELISAIKDIIRNEDHSEYYSKTMRLVDVEELSIAIVDSIKINENLLRDIIFEKTYVDKDGFSGELKVAGISVAANAIANNKDIIKISPKRKEKHEKERLG